MADDSEHVSPIFVKAPSDVRARLDAQCAHEERSVAAVVTRALRAYFLANPIEGADPKPVTEAAE